MQIGNYDFPDDHKYFSYNFYDNHDESEYCYINYLDITEGEDKTRPGVYSWPYKKMVKLDLKPQESFFIKSIRIVLQLGLDLKFTTSRS